MPNQNNPALSLQNCTIYALKVASDRARFVYDHLKAGEGRFGWSYVRTADLRALRSRIEEDGEDSLSEAERDCFQEFLMEIEPGDYVVYINVPKWGKCTTARVTREYYWKYDGKDFNHRFGVDPESVRSFDRNDAVVHPALSARLKLQGRWWRIYAKREFVDLLRALENGEVGAQKVDDDIRRDLLSDEIRPYLRKITRRIHRTHPGNDLEKFFATILEEVTGVCEVEWRGGPSDHGADIVAIVESRNPLTGQVRQSNWVIQVKSYEGTHRDTQAVDDIRRAFEYYDDVEGGLIISTAESSSAKLEDAVDRLVEESGKEVQLLIGEEVASFVLRHGADLL